MHSWQKYLAEAFGTMVLVGLGTGAILAAAATDSSPAVAVPLAFGFALITALYTVGHISGGHFNPAVSLAAFLDRRIDVKDLIWYWAAQFAGGILGSLLLALVTSRAGVAVTYSRPGEGVGTGSAFLGVAIFTTVFVMLILAVTRGAFATHAYLAIGLGLTAVHVLGLPVAGASVNPARSLAPFLVGDFSGLGRPDLWIYFAGPLLGAIVAWVLYKIIVEGDTDFRDDVAEIRDSM